MAGYIQKKNTRNWYRGALATVTTRNAVGPFSEDVISEFVEKEIVDINKINTRRSEFKCTSCRIQNLLPCPTKGCCKGSKVECNFHSTPDLIPRPCPNGFCDKLRDKIMLHHRFSSPSWKNTKAEEWCINSWQVAKCYLPPDGYIDVCHPDDTDFNGIISLLCNCTLFQKFFNDNLSNKGNVCHQARDVGRFIRHSPSLQVCDMELSGYFDALVALLSDATLQQYNLATKQAVRKLRKFKASPYVTSIEEEIAEESFISSSSDESQPKYLSDCLTHTISKGDDFWDTSDGSSNVEDGIETDTDSVGSYSASLSSENIQDDSDGEISTADQSGETMVPEVIINQISEFEQPRAPESKEFGIFVKELKIGRIMDNESHYDISIAVVTAPRSVYDTGFRKENGELCFVGLYGLNLDKLLFLGAVLAKANILEIRIGDSFAGNNITTKIRNQEKSSFARPVHSGAMILYERSSESRFVIGTLVGKVIPLKDENAGKSAEACQGKLPVTKATQMAVQLTAKPIDQEYPILSDNHVLLDDQMLSEDTMPSENAILTEEPTPQEDPLLKEDPTQSTSENPHPLEDTAQSADPIHTEFPISSENYTQPEDPRTTKGANSMEGSYLINDDSLSPNPASPFNTNKTYTIVKLGFDPRSIKHDGTLLIYNVKVIRNI